MEWLQSKKLTIPNTHKDVGQQEGMQTGTDTLEDSLAVLKRQSYHMIKQLCFQIFTWSSWKLVSNKNVHADVYRSFINNGQKLDASIVLQQMNWSTVVHPDNGMSWQ